MIAGIIAQVLAVSTPPPVGDTTALSPNWCDPRITLSGGNLTAKKDATDNLASVCSIDAKATGKWYFEATINSFGTGTAAITRLVVGVGQATFWIRGSEAFPVGAAGIGYRPTAGLGRIFTSSSGTSGDAFDGTWSVGDVIGVALDAGARQVYFRRNNGSWSSAYSLGGTLPLMPLVRLYGANTQVTLNFGATAFAQTPLSGHVAWTENAAYAGRYWRFQAYLGAGSGQSHAEVDFRETVGGSNLSRAGGTASASSIFSGSVPASNAVDGNNGTIWSSNGEQDSAWWQFDFGSTQTVRQVSITKRASSTQAFREGAVFYSSDGATWFPARAIVQSWGSAQETRDFAVADG